MNDEHTTIPPAVPGELNPPSTPLAVRAPTATSSDTAAVGRGATPVESFSGQNESLWRTHAYINEYIRFSDTKAAAVIAIAGGMLGLLFSSKVHRFFVTPASNDHWSLPWLSVAAFVLLVGAAVSGMLCVWPRLRSHQPKGFIFFGGIAEHPSQESFCAAFRAQHDEALLEHLAHHVHALATICQRKYLLVSISIIAVALGSLIAGFLLLVASPPA